MEGALNHLNGLACSERRVRRIGAISFFEDETIGVGGTGGVFYKGTHGPRRGAAIKCVSKDPGFLPNDNHYAADTCKNIVFLFGCEQDDHHFYIATQLCEYNLYGLVDNDWAYAGLMSQDGLPSAELLTLMKGVAAGVAHLHSLRIIHGDLNPSHVLIYRDKRIQGFRCSKLTGMGRSVRLAEGASSLAPNDFVSGTFGFRAPELLYPGYPQTPAIDMYSLGCILLFFMTQGKILFGELQRVPEAMDLISKLMDSNPKLRPKAFEVLPHPLFWDSDKRVRFLTDVSERVHMKGKKAALLVKELESKADVVFSGSSYGVIDNEVISYLKRRTYRHGNVQDLLRVIQKIVDDLSCLPDDIEALLGPGPLTEEIDRYFRLRFPKLLMVVYDIMRLHCGDEQWLSKYMKNEDFYFTPPFVI